MLRYIRTSFFLNTSLYHIFQVDVKYRNRSFVQWIGQSSFSEIDEEINRRTWQNVNAIEKNLIEGFTRGNIWKDIVSQSFVRFNTQTDGIWHANNHFYIYRKELIIWTEGNHIEIVWMDFIMKIMQLHTCYWIYICKIKRF